MLCTVYGRGREHDFKLFKRSRVCFAENTACLGDRGYQGLQKQHARSQTPHKKPPRQTLSKEARRANRELAKRRIVIEHVIGKLKVFRLLLERYRNRRRRFGLRTNLIAVVHNLELKHRSLLSQEVYSTANPCKVVAGDDEPHQHATARLVRAQYRDGAGAV